MAQRGGVQHPLCPALGVGVLRRGGSCRSSALSVLSSTSALLCAGAGASMLFYASSGVLKVTRGVVRRARTRDSFFCRLPASRAAGNF